MAEQSSTPPPPVVIDGGVRSGKAIKRLKKGRGKLFRKVQKEVASVRALLGEEAKGKEIVPVVVLYRRKRKTPAIRLPLFPPF